MTEEHSIAERSGDDPIIWVEKYRPKTVDECILPERIKKTFKSYIRKKDFPNLLLTGTAGTGKTTIARALCNELNYDYIIINASDERNIDTVRTRIKDFASTSSLEGNKKAIILDEADGLNKESAQPALRAAIEEFTNTRFILTCNYKNKLIEPLRSRTSVVEFSVNSEEASKLKIEFLKRIFEILDLENVTYDQAAVGAVIKAHFPDNRRILNQLQGYCAGDGGEIDSGIIATLDSSNANNLVKMIKDQDFGACKQWVEDNADVEYGILYRAIYDEVYKEAKANSVMMLTELAADYNYKAAFVADIKLNTLAFISGIMSNIEFE